MRLDEEWSLKNNSGYTRWSARSHNGCYRQHTGTPRCTQTSKTPYPHENWKVHWCWQRNFRKCIVFGKTYQLCHLKNKYQYYKQYVRSLYQQICNCTVKYLYLWSRSKLDTSTYTLLLTMTNNMTSENIEISSWDTLYKWISLNFWMMLGFKFQVVIRKERI